MKQLNLIILLISIISLFSCKDDTKYPIYSLQTTSYIPDSLQSEYRTWITETVRAASQHMTGGDYEDVDETISQVVYSATCIFTVNVIGLRKRVDDNKYNDIILTPGQLTPKEKVILDSLLNVK